MPWNTIAIAGATILAAISAVLLTQYLNRKKNGTRWKLLNHKDTPMWIVHNVYRDGFPDKYHPIRKDSFFLKGSFFEYSVKIADHTIREPEAKIRHLKVLRRKRKQ